MQVPRAVERQSERKALSRQFLKAPSRDGFTLELVWGSAIKRCVRTIFTMTERLDSKIYRVDEKLIMTALKFCSYFFNTDIKILF